MTNTIVVSDTETIVITEIQTGAAEPNFNVNRFTTQSSNGVQKLVDSISLPTNRGAAYSIKITGQDIASEESFVATLEGFVRNFGGDVNALDDNFGLTKNHTANAGTWDVSAAINNVTKAFDIFVTGETGRTITWDVRVETTIKDII